MPARSREASWRGGRLGVRVPATSADPLFTKARRRWAQTDPRLAAVAREAPLYKRALEPGDAFESLVMSIAHQQVSLAAGRAIFGRVAEAAGGRPTPEALLALGPERLRGAGLSRPKVAYVLDLAQKCASREVDLAQLRTAPDEEVIAALTSVKGIGVWTAKMHLIFHLERPDVLPHEDLGLVIAVERVYGVPRKKAAKKMLEMRPAWSPYSSYAALTLWNWRHVMEAREAEAPPPRPKKARR